MTNTEAEVADYKAQQFEFWNGEMGELWVRKQSFIDEMLRPVERGLVERVASLSPKNVLDVGCGNGAATLLIAKAIAPNGHCIGIDLSQQMIANAQTASTGQRSRTGFVSGDAETYVFSPNKFDVLCSRFGVMFFADPVAAFRNLRRAATQDAKLCLIVWKQPCEGDFMTAGQRAAADLLPEWSKKDPTAPGPFSFGAQERVTSILTSAGWSEIAFESFEPECAFPSADLPMFLENLAPIGVDFNELSDPLAAELWQAINAAYEPFIDGRSVRFTAPCWVITGRAAESTATSII